MVWWRRSEERAAFPRDEPNDNDPADVPPATVGPQVYNPGDPDGIVITGEPGPPRSGQPPRPQPWSGWPAEWPTPNWRRRSEELTDVAWSCIDLNSRTLATMPPYLVDAASSLDAAWLTNPQPLLYNSWWDFARQLFWDWQGVGEVFVIADAYYSTGYPAAFHVVPAWMVNVDLDGAGMHRYSIGGLDVTGDVLHITYQGGQVGEAHGHGPLEAGWMRLVAARLLGRYAVDLVESGGIPHSLIVYPGRLTAEQRQELQFEWVTNRLAAMGMPAVLSGGVDFRTVSFNPKDLGLVDIAQMNEARICYLLGVPAHMQGLPTGADPLTYSNTRWIFEHHWRATLSTFASAVMQALSGWLLPASTSVEVNRDEYVKPEPKERAETDKIWNEIRDDQGRPAKSVAEIREGERFGITAPRGSVSEGVLQ